LQEEQRTVVYPPAFQPDSGSSLQLRAPRSRNRPCRPR
jgi:hypothetical protein